MELSWGAPEDHNSHSQLQCAPDVVSHKSPPKQQPDVRQHGNDEKGAATSAPVHNSATSPTTVKQTNKEGYKNLQNLLRRIIQQEFTTKCTQRSIAILQIICDTLCSDPVGVVKVMEVLNDQFEAAIKAEQQQQLLNYWYIVDAVLKLFRDRPAMLNAVTVALPHMLIRYVPWQKSALAKESWIQCERDSALYENLFRTWERTVSKNLMDDIWALWKGEVDLELDGKAGTSTE
ncbi:hypothetical protein TRVL_03419 [Trypanosoma vivax]|nr:hypothetical protein TRVL_03419 [Trypanosoma vivax]